MFTNLAILGASHCIITGWWFGTFLFFPYIGNVIIPTDFHIFQRDWNHQPDYHFLFFFGTTRWSDDDLHRILFRSVTTYGILKQLATVTSEPPQRWASLWPQKNCHGVGESILHFGDTQLKGTFTGSTLVIFFLVLWFFLLSMVKCTNQRKHVFCLGFWQILK